MGEQIKVGDRFEDPERVGTKYHVRTVERVVGNAIEMSDGGIFFLDGPYLARLKRIPAPPACKAPAWCGVELDSGDSRDTVYLQWNCDNRGAARVYRGAHRYCSESCAYKPPVGVPVVARACGLLNTPGCNGGHYEPHTAECVAAAESYRASKPAPAASPAKGLCPTCKNPGGCSCANPATPAKAKEPVCIDCEKPSPTLAVRILTHGTRLLMCDGCYLAQEHNDVFLCQHGTGVSMMAKLPERLQRARMARDEMQESDCLEDAR